VPSGPAVDVDDGRAAPSDVGQRPALRGWLHVGAFVAVLVVGPLLVLRAHSLASVVALTVYVVSLAGLFGVSALFHRVRWSPVGRRRMRRADHTTIFLAIAGTYTAVAVLVLHGGAELGILCLVWAGAVVGVTIRQVWLDAPKWVVAVPYVVVGWCVVVVAPQVYRGIGPGGFALLLIGGLFYTAGALAYALRRPNPIPGVVGYHEVFHACTLCGAALQLAAIGLYALPHR